MNLCALFEIWVVCFCVSMGVWGVGYCPVPVPVRCGTLVVGQSCTGGVLWCGNVADSTGTVPVPYRYDTVRYRVGKNFVTLGAGSGSTGAGAIYGRFWLSLDDSERYSIVRCVGVYDWY